MAVFHENILKARKDETIGLLKIIMENLQEYRIPSGFDTYTELIEATLPYLHEGDRILYNTGLQIGLEQARLIQSLKEQENPADYSFFQLEQGKEAIKSWLNRTNKAYN